MAANLTIDALLAQGVNRLAGGSAAGHARTATDRRSGERTPFADEGVLDAELLLAHVLGKTRTYLKAYPERIPTPEQAHQFGELLERRVAGEPIAYIVGYRDFWTLTLAVNPSVLVPRPETELLVERALALGPEGPAAVADLGTGSGAIALALASERPQWKVTAVDLSAAALSTARANAASVGLTHIEFVEGPWFAPLKDRRFHVVASNPPYVSEGDEALKDATLQHEPQMALASGPDGLSAIREIVQAAPDYLERHGWLILSTAPIRLPPSRMSLSGAASVTYAPTAISPATGASRRGSGSRRALHKDTFTMIKFETSHGSFTVELFTKEAPISAENFQKYVDDKFFDGTIFHRIIPNFMIQGGGMDKEFASKETRPAIKNEAKNGLKNKRGTLSMARTSDINSATSQFFVNLVDNTFLDNGSRDYGYAVFGRVAEGMDTVDKIAAVKTGRRKGYQDAPMEDVVIISATTVGDK